MPMMVRMRKTALMMRTRRMTPMTRMRRTTPTTRTRMTRRMVMKMQKMTNVNGKTGASGLVNAAHSLADVLAVKLVAGPLTTSCLIRAAADSSVPDVKLTRACEESDCESAEPAPCQWGDWGEWTGRCWTVFG